ncbi:MAG: patatin family protein [Aristaeellaceae bacterium]
MLGLVMEGGAMRGLFTAGVMDVMMERHLRVDGAIGVSAGAVFGCNLKSGQPGRVLRYNTRYCRNWRYASFRSLLLTGDLYGERFCYHDIPERLDPFDQEAFAADPMVFYCVCTDVDTGEPVYHRCDTGDAQDQRWLQASASMPMVSRVVVVDGMRLLDGGASDSIPLRAFEGMGYDRNIVILTQPESFVKEPNNLLPLMRLTLRKYPKLIETMASRHDRYNAETAYVRKREQAGACLVIRPPHALDVRRVERDPEKLRAAYRLGRETAEARLGDIQSFIREAKQA